MTPSSCSLSPSGTPSGNDQRFRNGALRATSLARFISPRLNEHRNSCRNPATTVPFAPRYKRQGRAPLCVIGADQASERVARLSQSRLRSTVWGLAMSGKLGISACAMPPLDLSTKWQPTQSLRARSSHSLGPAVSTLADWALFQARVPGIGRQRNREQDRGQQQNDPHLLRESYAGANGVLNTAPLSI